MPVRPREQQPLKDAQLSMVGTTKRVRRTRPFPVFPLEQTIAIAQSIADNNAGRPYSRLSIAESLKRSPESSEFRALVTSSSSYGLTEGGYSATQLNLTELGQSIVMPQTDDERGQALVSAALNIELFQRLYEQFDQRKLPPNDNFKNTLIRHFKVDPTLADECIDHFRADGRFAGLIRTIAGGERVDLQASQAHTLKTPPIEDESSLQPADPAADQQVRSVASTPGVPAIAPDQPSVPTQRVFITHGRNQSVVGQVKELLQFGKFDPVVAEEHETPSVPVPDKVMDDMRSCFAGVIHIESEEDLLDSQGNTHHRINENVLIEIGAALALYKRNVVLLVQQGLHLPSNLQGLYRCDYAGNKLDYEATMKLLKTFSGFK